MGFRVPPSPSPLSPHSYRSTGPACGYSMVHTVWTILYGLHRTARAMVYEIVHHATWQIRDGPCHMGAREKRYVTALQAANTIFHKFQAKNSTKASMAAVRRHFDERVAARQLPLMPEIFNWLGEYAEAAGSKKKKGTPEAANPAVIKEEPMRAEGYAEVPTLARELEEEVEEEKLGSAD